MSSKLRLDRYQGCLVGLAVGDAVGTTLEFQTPGTFVPIEDMMGGGPFGLAAGQWTDDTSMALCLADSLLACDGFEPTDQLKRYCDWYRHGYRSSTGACFDIGGTVRAALERFEHSGDPFCGSEDPDTAGNGSIMRLAPIPMFYADDPATADQRAVDSSRTTHAAPAAVDACRLLNAMVIVLLSGGSKEDACRSDHPLLEGFWEAQPLVVEIDEIRRGSFLRKDPPEVRGTGYVVASLEAALWAFDRSSSFREGCLLAANLGDDADTTAAVYGQIAGAYYGLGGIPELWRTRLYQGEAIRDLATQLYRARSR